MAMVVTHAIRDWSGLNRRFRGVSSKFFSKYQWTSLEPGSLLQKNIYPEDTGMLFPLCTEHACKTSFYKTITR